MITSIQNQKVKQWNKLKTKKERIKTSSFLVEGFHLVEEAWKSNWQIHEIILQENISLPSWCENFPVEIVTESVFKTIAQTTTPQGIAAVISMKKYHTYTGNQVLLVDEIQDPGNLGTIIRTADAAGFAAIILGKGTVDMYNEKVIRATQGSLFHIPVIEADLQEEITKLKQNDFAIWAATLENAVHYTELAVSEKTALIVGNEGAGINSNVMKLADQGVKIPIYGKAESLNVSIAAAILMYYIKN